MGVAGKRITIVGAVALLATLVLLIAWPSRPDELRWLSKPAGIKPPPFRFLGKYRVPVIQTWMRIKNAFLGPPKTVLVGGLICEMDSVPALDTSTNVVWRRTNDAGDQVWLIADPAAWTKAENGRAHVAVLTRPRMTMGEGQPAQMASYDIRIVGPPTNLQKRNVGWWTDVTVKRMDGPSYDLTCFFISNEVHTRVPTNSGEATAETFLYTNFSFGAQVRVPANSGVFLISGRTNSHGHFLGALVTASRK